MPKPPQRDKNFQAGSRTGSRVRGGKAIAVKDLLAKAGITASAIAQRTVKQETWQEFFQTALPDGLAAHISAVSAEGGILTVLADSPSWAVRLRYALQESLPRIREHDARVHSVAVKVAGR